MRPLGTAMGPGGGGGGDGPRPMTSNKGAGYSSTPKVMGNIGGVGLSKGPAPPLLKKSDDGRAATRRLTPTSPAQPPAVTTMVAVKLGFVNGSARGVPTRYLPDAGSYKATGTSRARPWRAAPRSIARRWRPR
jgi:hypothetical protein